MGFNFIKDFLTACDRYIHEVGSYDELACKLSQAGYSPEVRAKYIKPPLAADLHLHSNCSDGQLFPRQVAWMARLIGLKAAALVDHNSITGTYEFVTTARQLGLEAWAGAELGTTMPGCEILVYFPKTEPFFRFLKRPEAAAFINTLQQRQDTLDQLASQAIPELNTLLARMGKTDFITEEELARWYSGVKPYYPGTLSVLFLKRLTPDEQSLLGIFNPRQVTAKILTPILEHLQQVKPAPEIDTFSLIRDLKKQDFPVLAVLAHPVEMIGKGRLSLEEIRDYIMDMALNHDLDGIEVRNPRDGEEEAAEWHRDWEMVRRELKAKKGRDFWGFSFNSDFHILIPRKDSATFILGYGLLDEAHPEGNGKPDYDWTVFRAMLENGWRDPGKDHL
ncbi:MAG: PHP domain-containing protein [Bacillota bacterium]